MHDFVNKQDRATLEMVPILSIFSRDLPVGLKKRIWATVDMRVVRVELSTVRAAKVEEEAGEKTHRGPAEREGKRGARRILIHLFLER